MQEKKIFLEGKSPFDSQTEGKYCPIEPHLEMNKTTKIVRKLCKIEEIVETQYKEDEQQVKSNSWMRGDIQDKELEKKQPILKGQLINSYSNFEAKQGVDLIDGPQSGSFYNLFFYTYISHGDLILTPDDVWLQIILGFSKLVSEASQELRSLFVGHEGKQELIVKMLIPVHGVPNQPSFKWDVAFANFEELIGQNTKDGIQDLMVANFSTTTPLGRAISSISVMDVMKHYFDYTMMLCGCGFQGVFLEGTKDDWENLVKKTKDLKIFCQKQKSASSYIINFLNKLIPTLDEFQKSFDGKVDLQFWNSCFDRENGYRSGASGCGQYPITNLTGWITHFYPFQPRGNTYFRNDGHNAPVENFTTTPQYYTEVPLKIILEKVDGEQDLKEFYMTDIISCFGGVLHKNNQFKLQTQFGIVSKEKNIFSRHCDILAQNYGLK